MPLLNWPKVQDNQVKVFNRIFQGWRKITFNIGSDSCEFHFVYPPPPHYSHQILFKTLIGEYSVMIGLETIFFTNLLDKFTAGDNFFDLPNEIKCAVLEVAAEPLFNRLSSVSGLQTALQEITIHPAPLASVEMNPTEYAVYFQLTRAKEGGNVYGHMLASFKALQWLADLWEKKVTATVEYPPQLNFYTFYVIAKTQLKMSEMAELCVNDIILWDESAFDSRQMVSLYIPPSLWYDGVFKGTQLTIQHIRNENIMDAPKKPEVKTAPDTKPVAANLNDLTVQIHFEVGQKEMTLGELKTIQPGYTIDLNGSLEKPVMLRANGKSIGCGEIIQIDQRLGVRILEIFKHADV
ncbi:MAG: type III secretion system cytoplasmic ring protein SctQ [Desulfobacterales bacterium]|nr:type III secretion system cytoplasmic ring protein SctQ [Desulfobacterales bacterium]